MGQRTNNNANILTNVKVDRIDTSNPYHSSVFNSGPYEYWQFEEVTGNSFTGLFNIATFNLYNSNTYITDNDPNGLRNTSGVSGGKYPNSSGSPNFYFTELGSYINNAPNQYTLEFWFKVKELEQTVIKFGNTLTDFGYNYPTTVSNNIDQFEGSIYLTKHNPNGTDFYKLNLDYKIWNNEQWIDNGSYYSEPLETEKLDYQSDSLELEKFHHVVIIYDNGNVKLYLDKNNVYESNLSNTNPSNTSGFKILLGESYSDAISNGPFIYDELAIYNKVLTEAEIKDHYSSGLTLPSISGWNPQYTSNNLYTRTFDAYNDYTKVQYSNIWNNAKGYKSNNTGRVMFEIEVKENDINKTGEIGFGVSNINASAYGKLGLNVPCSENSIALFNSSTSPNTYVLSYALNRSYGSETITGVTNTVNIGSIITIGVDFSTNTILFYVDNELITSFDWSDYIDNPNFYPTCSLKGFKYAAKLKCIPSFTYPIIDHAPWGALNSLPQNGSDDESYEWNGSYQDLLINDGPKHYWRFQENSGLVSIDEINGVDLQHTFGVVLGRTGVEGFCVYYNGTQNSYIQPFTPINLWREGMIGLWMNYDGDLNGTGLLFDLRATNFSWSLRLHKSLDSSNNPIITLSAYSSNPSTGIVDYSYTITLPSFKFNKWNHIMFGISEERLLECYVNGNKDVELCGVEWANKLSNYRLDINAATPSNVTFLLDELVFYDKSFTEDEVKTHYSRGIENISNTQNNDLIFKGIPKFIVGTNETTYLNTCPSDSYIRQWGYSFSETQWKELDIYLPNANLLQVSSSYNSMLMLKSDGKIEGLGSNQYNKLIPPSAIQNISSKMVASGDTHSVALLNDNTVFVWGNDTWGEVTKQPEGLTNVVQISAGASHTLALKSNGQVVAWGRNDVGQCNIPEELNNVVQIAAGSTFSVALKADGNVSVWGDNSWEQHNIPSSAENIIQISCEGSSDHITALKSDGTVICWGNNFEGQCDVPSGLNNVRLVSSGPTTTYAILTDNTVVAWGRHYYTLSNFEEVDTLVGTPNINSCDVYTENSFTISGPTSVESDNTYTYTITNYKENVDYNVSSNLGNVNIFGSTITLTTPSTAPSAQVIQLNVSSIYHEETLIISLERDPDILLDGPTEIIYDGSTTTYDYTILNYNSNYSYNVNFDGGTFYRFNDTITINIDTNLAFPTTKTLSVSRTGSTDSLSINISEDTAQEVEYTISNIDTCAGSFTNQDQYGYIEDDPNFCFTGSLSPTNAFDPNDNSEDWEIRRITVDDNGTVRLEIFHNFSGVVPQNIFDTIELESTTALSSSNAYYTSWLQTGFTGRAYTQWIWSNATVANTTAGWVSGATKTVTFTLP